MKRITQTVKQSRLIQVVILLAIIILAWAAYLRYVEHRDWAHWTGFGPKTLWDWLELLIVPIVLAVGAYWFNKSEKANDLKIADDRLKEQALQNYLDKMTELLLDRHLLEKKDSPDDPVVDVAQVRTVTTLRTLDTKRQNILIQFLRDSNLMNFILIGASLNDADLKGANLNKAIMVKANLISADLKWADLEGADLMGADLSWASLVDTDLSGATLMFAILSRAKLFGAILNGAILVGADLSEAHLMGAKLMGAKLMGANLVKADIRMVDLSGADLDGAEVSNGQLAEAKSLKAATMPDGKKFDPEVHKFIRTDINLLDWMLAEEEEQEQDLYGQPEDSPELLSGLDEQSDQGEDQTTHP